MLEPVSKIRLLDIPSISTEIVGVPCSNKMETIHIITAPAGAFRWKKLSSFIPISHFPFFFVSCLTPFFIPSEGLSQGERRHARRKHSLGFLLPGVVVKLTSLLSLVGHSSEVSYPSHSKDLKAALVCQLLALRVVGLPTLCFVVPTRCVTDHVLHKLSDVANTLHGNFNWGENDCILTELSNMV